MSGLPSNRVLNVERNSLCTAPGAIVSITASVCEVSHRGSVPDSPTDRIRSPPDPCPYFSRARYARKAKMNECSTSGACLYMSILVQ